MLSGVMQPTFSSQKRIAAGTTNPVLLMNLHSRSAQNCGIPLIPQKTGMASQGLRIHMHTGWHQTKYFPYTWRCFSHQIFNLWTREQSQELRYNVKSLPGTKLTDVKDTCALHQGLWLTMTLEKLGEKSLELKRAALNRRHYKQQ